MSDSGLPSADWLFQQQQELLGQRRMRAQTQPFWRSRRYSDTLAPHNDPPFLQSGSSASTRALEGKLNQLLTQWLAGDYQGMRLLMERIIDDLLSIDTRAPMIQFFAVGGVQLFMRFLCEPPKLPEEAPMPISGGFHYPPRTMNYIRIIAEITRTLTDVIVCDTSLSWYLYDCYPCVIYRLLELMRIPDLALVCCTMLEQMLAHLGPVLEIAKNPPLMRLLRSPHDGVVACACRITALLVTPSLTVGLTPFEYRRLTSREMILPFKRVQRVADSNALWLLSEPGLVERLIKLSETRVSAGVRVQAGNRAVAVMRPAEVIRLSQEAVPLEERTILDSTAAGGAPWGDLNLSNTLERSGEGGEAGAAPATNQFATQIVSALLGMLNHGEDQRRQQGREEVQNQQELPPSDVWQQSLANELARLPQRQSSPTQAELPERIPFSGISGPLPAAPTALGASPSSPSPNLDSGANTVMSPPVTTVPERGRREPVATVAPGAEEHGGGEDDAGSEGDWEDEPAEEANDEEGRFFEVRSGFDEDWAGEEGEFYYSDEVEEYYRENDLYVYEDAGERLTDEINEAVDQVLQQNAEDDETKVEVSWHVGITDTRERWHLRDPTLTAECDDNRVRLFGYAVTTPQQIRQFYEVDEKAMQALGAHAVSAPTGLHKVEVEHTVFNSQSEILYLLNVLLCTFYFSEPWKLMKECRWMERASAVFDTAFGLGDKNSVFVDIAPEVHLSERERSLPRFLTFTRRGEGESANKGLGEHTDSDAATALASDAPASGPPQKAQGDRRQTSSSESQLSSPQSPAVERAATTAPAVPNALMLGKDYIMPPMDEIYGRTRAAFATDGIAEAAQAGDDWVAEDNMQGPDMVRKLELLKGIHEFWHAQDRRECEMLQSDDIVTPSMAIAKKACEVILSAKENCAVEDSTFAVLQLYLRSFSYPFRTERCGAHAPQSEVGRLLLSYLLEHRIYNATCIPGLPNSLIPRIRLDSIGSLLCEMLMYHYDNLRHLARYVRGAVDLSALNRKKTREANRRASGAGGASSQHPGVHIRSQEQEEVARILAEPPLDREKYEPFASVLLRRIYCFGTEFQLVVRALVVSLTPGLRSAHNYMAKKHRQEETVPLEDSFLERTQTQDLITGSPQRLPYIRRISRAAAIRISLLQREGKDPESTKRAVGQQLVELVHELVRAPNRLPLAERPYPEMFDDGDMALLRGTVEPAEPGTRKDWTLPLFGSVVSDSVGLRHLAPLSEIVLGEPHKLIFSMIRPFEAERIDEIGFLTAVTSSIATVLRVAKLEGVVPGVHRVLGEIKPLAEVEYKAWKAEVTKRRRKARDSLLTNMTSDAGCTCDVPSNYVVEYPEDEAVYRCTAFASFGSCRPEQDARSYYEHFGGCFYRNYFRVLCVWLGHYAACQRFVEMLFYCTEVAFAEYKSICLYLLRELPQYFQEPLLL